MRMTASWFRSLDLPHTRLWRDSTAPESGLPSDCHPDCIIALEAVRMRPGEIEPRTRRWKKCVTLLDSKSPIQGLRHHQLGARDKEDRREGDFLATLDIGCGRAAFEINLARRHLLQTIVRRHRGKRDLDLHAVEFGGYVLHDLAAKVDRVPDRLLPAIEIGEGQRAFAVAERDRAAVLDLLQRSRERPDIRRLLAVGRCDEEEERRRGKKDPRPAQAAARVGDFSPRVFSSHEAPQAGLGVSAASSSPISTFSPSHLAIAAVASVLPITLVAERPMSRN